MRVFFTASIGLLVLVGVLFLAIPVEAQLIGGAKCCVKGPGDCYQKFDYNDTPNCSGGYSLKHDECDRISTCSESPTATVNCCVCPQSTSNYNDGVCFSPAQEGAPCGTGTSSCIQSSKFCTEESVCREWYNPVTTTGEEYKPTLVFFIPQVTIPGSGLFNQGQPIQITGATLGEYIVAIYFFFVSVAGILAVVMVMYGGVRYVVSMGSPDKTSEAKDTITSALVGLLIAIASYIILLTINPSLVNFDGLEVDSYFPIQQEEISEGTEKTATFNWQGNVDEFDKCLKEEATTWGIDPNRLKALMLVESAGDPNAKSSAGAYGLIQLLPSTADKYLPGVTAQQLLNPAININIAARLYRDLMINPCPTSTEYRSGKKVSCSPEKTKCVPGDHLYANAAYNGGQGANCSSITCPGETWWECEANEGYDETRKYVAKVQGAYEKIILSEQSPGRYPDFVWNDTVGLTCAQLRSQ